MNTEHTEKGMYLNEESGFIKHNGVRIISITDEESVLEADITENSTNVWGIVHGGLIFTMADTAAGAYARAHHNGMNVTVDTFISFLNPAKDVKKLCAVCRPRHVGRSVGTYCVRVTDDKGQDIAEATVTMRLFPAREHI